jgi:menaquinone-dependent protoporphyrinogen oxidase
MKVLVTAASKYGSTSEIAQAIGDELRNQGLNAEVLSPEDVTSLSGFDAVVLGSAVYAGRWRKPAREIVSRLGDSLRRCPVWLFSSGPIGDPPKPQEDPVDVRSVLNATGARDHRVFAGKLDRDRLNFLEKAVVVALRAPDGDFRDWDAIRGWARQIAGALQRGLSRVSAQGASNES